MSTVQEPAVAKVGDHALDAAILEDAEAWQGYGAAVQRGAPDDVRRSFFNRAMRTMRRVADALGERDWPLRSAEWRRG